MNNSVPQDQTIGSIIQSAKNLSSDEVAQILAYQKEKDVKFGEAAVALGFVNSNDVLWALSQQFKYDYSPSGATNANPELVVASRPFGDDAEMFRDLRTQLLPLFSAENGKRNALAVISNDIGDGKTFFAANLATAFSQLGRRTLLVDADMRTPRLQEVFGFEAKEGLSGILSGRVEPNVIKPIDRLPNLYILPVGVTPPNPLELVQSPIFKALLDELTMKFDFVIVDTPAAVHGADSRVIAATAGCSFAMAREGRTSLKSLKSLVSRVDKKDSKFLGVILNNY